jgi:hypothetical protein
LGRLVPHKRLPLLLEATAQIRGRWPGLEVRIVGAGPERRRLEDLSRRLSLEDVVRFVGWVPEEERARLLADSWLVVTPSAGEGWGLTVIEANSVGRPVLAFRVPGLVNSITEGVNGWLLDDIEELPAALEMRLGQLCDPQEMSRFDTRCRQWASRFTWERSAQRMADLVLGVRSTARSDRRPRPSGRSSDVATVVVLESSTELDGFETRLIPSDLWRIEGRTLRVLLQGQDQAAAISALEELGLSGRAHVRVARTSDLLLGLLEGD